MKTPNQLNLAYLLLVVTVSSSCASGIALRLGAAPSARKLASTPGAVRSLSDIMADAAAPQLDELRSAFAAEWGKATGIDPALLGPARKAALLEIYKFYQWLPKSTLSSTDRDQLQSEADAAVKTFYEQFDKSKTGFAVRDAALPDPEKALRLAVADELQAMGARRSDAEQVLVPIAQAFDPFKGDIEGMSFQVISEGLKNKWDVITGKDAALEARLDSLHDYLVIASRLRNQFTDLIEQIDNRNYDSKAHRRAQEPIDWQRRTNLRADLQKLNDLIAGQMSQYHVNLPAITAPAPAPTAEERKAADLRSVFVRSMKKLGVASKRMQAAIASASGSTQYGDIAFENSLFELAVAVNEKYLQEIRAEHAGKADLSELRKQFESDQAYFSNTHELLREIYEAVAEYKDNENKLYEDRVSEISAAWLAGDKSVFRQGYRGDIQAEMNVRLDERTGTYKYISGPKWGQTVDLIDPARIARIQQRLDKSGILLKKLVQTLSGSGDLPPQVEAMTRMFQNQNEAKLTFDQALESVKSQLGWTVDPREYLEFLPKNEGARPDLPFAVGTVGQIYKVRFKEASALPDDIKEYAGKVYALKLVMPGLEAELAAGRRTVPITARAMESIFPSFSRTLDHIATQATGLSRNIGGELNQLTGEEPNIIEFQEHFRGQGVHIPGTARKLTREKLMFSEWVEGKTLGEILRIQGLSEEDLRAEGQVKLTGVAQARLVKGLLSNLFFMVLTGKVHADLQHGNIMVDDKNGLVFIDLGQVARLKKGWFSGLVKGAFTGDKDRIVKYIMNSGILEERPGETEEAKAARYESARKIAVEMVETESFKQKSILGGIWSAEHWGNFEKIWKLRNRVFERTEKELNFTHNGVEMQLYRAAKPIFGAVASIFMGVKDTDRARIIGAGTFGTLGSLTWKLTKHAASLPLRKIQKWSSDRKERQAREHSARAAKSAAFVK